MAKNKKHTVLSIGGGATVIDGNKKDSKQVYLEKDFHEIKEYCLNNHLSLAEYVYEKEGERIKDYLFEVWQHMKEGIERGINTKGVLPGKLKLQRKAPYFLTDENNDNLPFDNTFKKLAAYAFANAEENASGGKVVTAPTCGSCGVLPAVLLYFSEILHSSDNDIIDALAVGGLIGNIVKQNGSISGAEAGCQAEIGTATAMAAAALASLRGLNIHQIECAAEIGIEHSLGLTCDPILGYVQIPCIERNALGAIKAVDAFYIAQSVSELQSLSFDHAVETLLTTGKDMHVNYKETAKGGLAGTVKKFS